MDDVAGNQMNVFSELINKVENSVVFAICPW